MSSRESPNPPPTMSATGPRPFGGGSGSAAARSSSGIELPAEMPVPGTVAALQDEPDPRARQEPRSRTPLCSTRYAPRRSCRSTPFSVLLDRELEHRLLIELAPADERADERAVGLRQRGARIGQRARARLAGLDAARERRRKQDEHACRERSHTSPTSQRPSAVTPEVWQPLDVTEIRFARSGDVDIAYRVVGDGPVDLVYVQGSVTHLEVYWELPQFRRYCERLSEFTRLILFDKRGMGMSDRVPGATTLEERMDDIRAIMDAVGSDRAAVMGESEGGPLAMLFAAAHPGRTSR